MSPAGAQGALWPTQEPRSAARPRRTARKQTTVIISADAIAAVRAGGTTAERVIAEAIRAARPEVRNVAVDVGSIRWTNPKTDRRVASATPPVVRDALLALDRGVAPAPFRFAIGRMVVIRGEA